MDARTDNGFLPVRRWLPWLALVLALSAALRLALLLGRSPWLQFDTGDYLQLAHALRHLDFSSDTGMRTPGYPLFLLALGYSARLVRLVQMTLGLVTTAALFSIVLALTRRPAVAALGAAFYGLNLPQVIMENTLLTEAFTTFLVVVGTTMIVWLWTDRSRHAGLKMVVLALCFGFLPLVRPVYAFMPIVALAVVFHFARRPRRRAVAVALLALLPMLVWSSFNYARFDSFGLATGLGLNLTNKTGSYIQDAPDKYAVIRDLYARARQVNEGRTVNAVWLYYRQMMQATGKSFPELSNAFLKMDVELIATHPGAYATNTGAAFLDFFKWPELDIRLPGLDGLTNAVWQMERWIDRALGGAFLLLVAYWIGVAVVRRTWRPACPLLLLMAAVVLATDVLCALIEFGDSARFGMPVQPLVVTVVIVTLTGFVSHRADRKVSAP